MKKGLKLSIVFALILAGIVACRKDDFPRERHRICFGVSPLVETKGRDTLSLSTLDSMAVYATYCSDAFGDESEIGNYFWNVKASRPPGGKIFNTEGEYYWPVSGKLSFFAIAPYDAEAVCDKEAKGSMRLTVTPSSDISSQKDICYATPVLDQPLLDDPVKFSFHHCMTCIIFKASYSDPSGVIENKYAVRVDSLILSGIKGSRELTVKKNGYAEWSDKEPAPEEVSYILTRSGNLLSDKPIVKSPGESIISTLNGQLYLIPQESEGAKMTIVYSFVAMDGAREETVSSFRVETDISVSWEASEFVYYKISIDLGGLTEITVSAESGKWIDDWNQTGLDPDNYTIE